MLYPFNTNFIVNFGNAKSSDVLEIVKLIEKVMKEKYNKLQCDLVDTMRYVLYDHDCDPRCGDVCGAASGRGAECAD